MGEKDYHTENCCKACGCKLELDLWDQGLYNIDLYCSVKAGRKKQSKPCGDTSVCNSDFDEWEDY